MARPQPLSHSPSAGQFPFDFIQLEAEMKVRDVMVRPKTGGERRASNPGPRSPWRAAGTWQVRGTGQLDSLVKPVSPPPGHEGRPRRPGTERRERRAWGRRLLWLQCAWSPGAPWPPGLPRDSGKIGAGQPEARGAGPQIPQARAVLLSHLGYTWRGVGRSEWGSPRVPAHTCQGLGRHANPCLGSCTPCSLLCPCS